MGRAVRTSLTRLSPLCWLALVIMVVLQLCGVRSPDGVPMLLASLAVAGTLAGPGRERGDEDKAQLISLLAEATRPRPDHLQREVRRAR
jgi:hypothetical protein